MRCGFASTYPRYSYFANVSKIGKNINGGRFAGLFGLLSNDV